MPTNGSSLERGLPASIEAERSILGSVLLDNGLWDQAAEHLSPDDFSLDGHRRIYAAMQRLREAEKPIDMILLSEELDRRKEVEAVGGMVYLSSLIDGVVERPSIRHYVQIVHNKALLRGAINIAQNTIAEAIEHADEAPEVIARAEQAILQLSEEIQGDRKWMRFADSVKSAGGMDEYLHQMTNPEVLSGTPTGYTELDKYIGGVVNGNLIVIAARPSMGKTSLALSIVTNIALREPESVAAFFSLETPQRGIEARLLTGMSRVNLREYSRSDRTFQFDANADGDRISNAMATLIGTNIFIDDSSYLTPLRLRSKARQLKREKGRLDLVIVDYLQLMAGGEKFENRQQEVSAISRGLKSAAKELECPVVALSQLSRAVEGRSDKRPILSDLRESGSLEQDADVVILIFRPELYSTDTDLQGLAELNVAKNRDGATGIANLCFMASFTRFENLAVI